MVTTGAAVVVAVVVAVVSQIFHFAVHFDMSSFVNVASSLVTTLSPETTEISIFIVMKEGNVFI